MLKITMTVQIASTLKNKICIFYKEKCRVVDSFVSTLKLNLNNVLVIVVSCTVYALFVQHVEIMV